MIDRRLQVVALGVVLALGAGCRDREKPEHRIRIERTPDPGAAALATLNSIELGDPAIDWDQLPLPAGAGEWVVPQGYAGDRQCAVCHEEISELYGRHSMARAGIRPIDPARDAAVVAAFADAAPVPVPPSPYAYRPYRQGKRFYVEELVTGDDDRMLHSRVQEVTHTFASGTFGQAFAYRSGSYFYQIPIDWYPEAGRWAVDPGFGQGNARFGRPLLSFCVGCHSSPPAHLAGVVDAVREPLPSGVGCERCHGPGARHSRSGKPEHIVNPATLPPVRQLDVCAQCHLQGTAEILRPGRDAYAFRPGEPLHETRINYVEAQPHATDFQLTGHSDRLVRSACYTGSGAALTCTTCHDPHRSSRDTPRSHYRQACLGCHQEPACTAPAEARSARDDDCAGCHMRTDTPHDFRLSVPGIALPTTDHWIRTEPPPPVPLDQQTQRRRPGPVQPYATLTGEEVGEPHRLALHGAAMRASGHAPAALDAFATAASGQPPVRELYAFVADQYQRLTGELDDPLARTRAAQRLVAARAAAVRATPDDIETLLAYARVAGDGSGLQALERALALVPDHPDALIEKALHLHRAGDQAEALPLLERAIQVAPEALAPPVILGIAARAAGRAAEAIGYFQAALLLAPDDLWLHDQLLALSEKAPKARQRIAARRAAWVARGARLEDSRSVRWAR